MPLDFPSNPTVNEQYVYAGRTWVWNGAAWDSYNPGITAYVSRLNGFTGGVTLAEGSNVTISSANNIITISSSASGSSSVVTSFNGLTGTVTGVGSFNGSTGNVVFSNYISSFNGSTGNVVFSNYISSFNGLTGTVSGVTAINAGSGISVSGTTNVTITNTGVTGFNGATGNVTGVTGIAAGTGISVSGTTRSTITNTGVQTFNGLTGAVTGVTTSVSNTFTPVQIFNSGIQTNSILSTSGVGGTVYINSDNSGGGGNSITYIGDWTVENNGTNIQVDDQTASVSITANGGTNIYGALFNDTSIETVKYKDLYSYTQTFLTTTSSTTANQSIAQIPGVYDTTTIPATMYYPAFEVTISAYDTVLKKSEMLKMHVLQDGTNTVNTQYGLIRTGATGPVNAYTTVLFTPPEDVTALLIRATPSSTNSTKFVVTVRAQANG